MTGILSGTPESLVVTGNCGKCGRCCSNTIPISDEEVTVMRDYVQRNGIQPYRGNRGMACVSFKIGNTDFSEVMCPLRHPEKGCMIYNVRPKICRVFVCNNTTTAIVQQEMHNTGKYPVRNIDEAIFDIESK